MSPGTKPDSRLTAPLAWAAAILGGVLTILWIGSIFCSTSLILPGTYYLAVRYGTFEVGKLPSDFWTECNTFYFSEHDPALFLWWFDTGSNDSSWECYIPIWAPVLLCFAVSLLARRKLELARRRSRSGTTPTPSTFLHGHKRLRRTVKVTLALLTLLSLAALFISGRWGVAYIKPSGSGVTLFHGQMMIASSDGTASRNWSSSSTPPRSAFRFARQRYGIIWKFAFVRNPTGWLCWIPLWLFPAILLPITAIPWIKDEIGARRVRRNQCRRCLYDRTGLPPESVCPECGLPP